MKKLTKTFLLLVAVACCANFILFTNKAEAITLGNIPLQVVDDLDNTPYPETNVLNYANDNITYAQFTLDTPGQVKAIFRSELETSLKGDVWISTDITGNAIIGDITKLTGSTTEKSWFLEAGTYYLFSSSSYYPFKSYVSLLFEKSKVAEANPTTSFTNCVYTGLDKTVRGFLTNTNPNDYYSFSVDKKATVTINYSFDTTAASSQGVGYCSLYDSNELLLKEGTYNASDKGTKSISYLVEPGTYYVKLHGLLGNTTVSVSPMYYDITLTPVTDNKWTKKHIHVNIDTTVDYSSIMVLFKDVKDSLLNNSELWSKSNAAYVALDGESFIAAKSGTYSVRITDKYGNNTMKKIVVSNIDVTTPAVKGVTDGKSYKSGVTLTWSDTQSGINTAKTTLNGKVVSSGVKVTTEGKYTLKVYDKIGNYKTVTFNVDRTAPVAGVENGKTYSDSVTLKFKDSVSGIKKITLDDAEVPITSTTMYCYLDGAYTVELWDNAGNHRVIEFNIKK